MADTIKVRLKTNDKNSVVLHPETEWSVVLNRPSIEKQFSDNPSNPNSTNSVINKVSGVMGRDGEGWNTYKNNNNSIVVGNDENALGFCGSNSKNYRTILQSKHDVVITTEATVNLTGKNVKLTGETDVGLKGKQINIDSDYVMIKSKDTGHLSLPLSSYPINVYWDKLKGSTSLNLENQDKTSTVTSSVQNAVFGVYVKKDNNGTIYYPAFAVTAKREDGSSFRASCFYFKNNGTIELIDKEDPNIMNFYGISEI